ncbi:MAG TPA: AvaI/BsoBI family type II restriction endonuclease [Chthonomonadaceae bacterium]|nr:AvaI/BsoBI family type II restriction endonuclease [Chthonomonadaceae bacterium]
MLKPHHQHLASSSELVTTYAERRAGFIALALEKSRRATPFVEQARVLKASASLAAKPADLLTMDTIQPALLTASGLSDKAVGHLQPEDKTEAIRGLIEQFLEPAGSSFVEELVYRFLLTRGDTLGGSMRNIGGILAQQKLTRAILASLTLAGISYSWLHGPSKVWIAMSGNDAGIERHLRGIHWRSKGNPRTVLYNFNVPLVKNNVDLSMLECTPEALSRGESERPERYLALGELKGGIDPAGADEHWKTARTALSRIRQAFATHNLMPQTFFVGAAIEKKMAEEIWDELEQGTLSNAANLTNSDQVSSLCLWLVNL